MSHVKGVKALSCAAVIEIGCTSCLFSLLAGVYLFVKNCYHYVIPLLGSLLVLITAYAFVEADILTRAQRLKCSAVDGAGLFLLLLLFCIRLRFRYLIFPFIYTEHCRIFTDEYLTWWSGRIFSRVHLGIEDDEPCFEDLHDVVETFTDYVLCLFVNFIVLIGFIASFTVLISWWVLFHIFLLLWPSLLLVGFLAYPLLFVPDLLLASCHHLCSATGGFSLLLLAGLFRALNFHLRFVYSLEYDIPEWLEHRQHYTKLWKLVAFLCFYSLVGPRALTYVNNDTSLGLADPKQPQGHCVVCLTLEERGSLALEAALALGVSTCFFLSPFSPLAQYTTPLLACCGALLLAELYLNLVWPRWTPESLQTPVYPEKGEQWGDEEDNHEKPSALAKQKSAHQLVW